MSLFFFSTGCSLHRDIRHTGYERTLEPVCGMWAYGRFLHLLCRNHRRRVTHEPSCLQTCLCSRSVCSVRRCDMKANYFSPTHPDPDPGDAGCGGGEGVPPISSEECDTNILPEVKVSRCHHQRNEAIHLYWAMTIINKLMPHTIGGGLVGA